MNFDYIYTAGSTPCQVIIHGMQIEHYRLKESIITEEGLVRILGRNL